MCVKGREATSRNSEQELKTLMDSDKHEIMKQIRKCMHHQTMTASLKYTSRATESIYMKQAIPIMHMNMRNSANCKQTEKASGSSRNVEGMSRRPRRCRASRGNLKEASETPGAQGKLGRQWEGQEAGKAQAFGSILGWPQAT